MTSKLRTTLLIAALSALPMTAQAQQQDDVTAACGASGDVVDCALLIASLSPSDPLRTFARNTAAANGIDLNVLGALAGNFGNRGIPGTPSEDSDNKASGQNDFTSGSSASPT